MTKDISCNPDIPEERSSTVIPVVMKQTKGLEMEVLSREGEERKEERSEMLMELMNANQSYEEVNK
jgi:hypothetical protein